MKKGMTVFGAIMIALIILTSCGGSSSKESTEIITDPAVTTEVSVSTSEEPTAIETEGATKEKTDGATKDLVDTIKTKLSQKTPTQQLRLTPLNISGEIGHVTFSQKGKTIFYYDAQTKRGKIILNGSEYILTKIEGSYKLSGNNVNITTTKGKWKEMESDCAYGKALVVTIKMGSQALQLNNVEVQDCQSMVE